MRQLRFLIPLIIFLMLITFLWRGLYLDPRQLPSALINKPVPVFSLPTIENPQIYFNNKMLLGKVSLLNVWATWCLSCRAEHPFLMDLARTQKIPIYGLDYKDERNASQEWLKQYGNPYQLVGFDADGGVGIDWGVYGTPETFVIDNHGIIRYKLVGELTPQIWQEKILPLVLHIQQLESIDNP